MKFYVNRSGFSNYQRLVEKHGHDLCFIGEHKNDNYEGINTYYRMNFDGIFKKIDKINFESYQNMLSIRYWKSSMYEINIDFEGSKPKRSLMCIMRPNKYYENILDKSRDTYRMYLSKNSNIYQDQSLYYTLTI